MGIADLYDGDVSGVLEVIALADRKGIGQISMGDHMGFAKSAHAARLVSHKFPYTLEYPWHEPISLLSAAAAITTQVRLSTFVLIAPLRPTLLLAKQLATLDVISKGRVMVGLGVGWQEAEYRAAGMAFDTRFSDLEDMVGGMRALWGSAPATFKGRSFGFEDFYAYPQPVQGRDLGVLFGLNPTSKNLDRMARLSQGWAMDPAYRPILAERAKELRRLFAKYGRDPDKIEIHVGQRAIRTADGSVDWAAVEAGAKESEADGATTVSFRVSDFCRSREEIEGFFERVVSLGK
ncbi:TIGR03619 family F420-dependent LLM class oxidoreductase [Phenylobacterium sp.]|uniref:TIGR03619 family F420-dependent LLM class oxidoreductase n=1 Tax=Phenylobacterium sp. TaxID=1871053 RepID=UPI002F406AB4